MTKQKNKKKGAVLFDVDDTLLVTIDEAWYLYRELGKRVIGTDISDENLKEHWGKPYDKLLQGLFPDEKLQDLKVTVQKFREKLRLKSKAHEGAVELVERLCGEWVVGAVTSSSKEYIFNRLEEAGFDLGCFCFVQVAEDTEVHKPDPEVFEPAFEKLLEADVGRDGIVYVGDSLDDYFAARRAAIEFMAVTNGLFEKKDFINAGLSEELIFEDLKKFGEKII